MLSLDFDQSVAHFLQHLEGVSKRRLIGLAGVPGSGKSTMAARLCESVNAAKPQSMIALGMDGFHLSRAKLREMPNAEEAFARRGAPWTFDAQAFARRLQAVRGGANREPVDWPDFQHEIGDPVEAAHIVAPETRLVLIEGNYLLHQEDGWNQVDEMFDERAFLDVALDVALERLALRHRKAWNISREQALARIAANDALNAQLVLRDRERADWILVE